MLRLASRVQLSVTPWTVALQAPLSMGFFRHEHWSGLPCPPPGDLPNPGMEPRSPALQADSLPDEPQGKPLIPVAKLIFPYSVSMVKLQSLCKAQVAVKWSLVLDQRQWGDIISNNCDLLFHCNFLFIGLPG